MVQKIVPGKTPITADLVNDLLADTEANSRMRVSPGLDLVDCGSAGKVVVKRQREGTSPSGFYARLSVGPDEDGNPQNPQAYWAEVATTTDAQTGLSTFIDTPDGRSGILGSIHAVGGAIQNIGPRSRTQQWVTLSGAARNGDFTLTWTRPDGQGGTTSPIPLNATAATVQDALAALPNIGAGNVAVWADGTRNGGAGGPWLVEFPFTPWYPDPTPGLPQSDPNNAVLRVDVSGVEPDPPDFPPAQLVTVERVRVAAPGPFAFNMLPDGEIVWVEPIGDGSLRQYLFQLPYAGMWGRITGRGDPETVTISGLPAVGNTPAVPPHDTVIVRYSFIESQLGGTLFFRDAPDGLRSDTAIELNHDLSVPPNTVVWLVPIFIPGVGGFWVFEGPIDIRLLQAAEDGTEVSGKVLSPRGGDGICRLVTPSVWYGTPDDGAAFVTTGAYFGVRVDVDEDGIPIFVAPARIGPPPAP